MGLLNTARYRRYLFYLVIRSSLLLRFYMPAFLQSACLLSVDYSEELCSHRSTFQFESAQQTGFGISENVWKCVKAFERLWSYLKAIETLLCLCCPCRCCWIELDEPSTHSWQESASSSQDNLFSSEVSTVIWESQLNNNDQESALMTISLKQKLLCRVSWIVFAI